MARLRALALGLPPRADRARAVPAGARAVARRRGARRCAGPAADHDDRPGRAARVRDGALHGYPRRRSESPTALRYRRPRRRRGRLRQSGARLAAARTRRSRHLPARRDDRRHQPGARLRQRSGGRRPRDRCGRGRNGLRAGRGAHRGVARRAGAAPVPAAGRRPRGVPVAVHP